MTKEFIYAIMRQHRLGVLATTAGENYPEAALVGIAVTPDLEIIFDTVKRSRKYANLLARPRVAFVIGWKLETTIQYEGIAVQLDRADEAYRELYYSVFPEGRERTATWEGLVHFKIKPLWIRYSDFKGDAVIEEMRFAQG